MTLVIFVVAGRVELGEEEEEEGGRAFLALLEGELCTSEVLGAGHAVFILSTFGDWLVTVTLSLL